MSAPQKGVGVSQDMNTPAPFFIPPNSQRTKLTPLSHQGNASSMKKMSSAPPRIDMVEKPVLVGKVKEKIGVERPVVEKPVLERPVIMKPVLERPALEKPVLERPVFEKPVFEKPVLERPVFEKPVVEKPVFEKPILEKPVLEKPILEKPVLEKPVLEKPVLERPVIEKPVLEKPVMERPVMERPVLERPILERPVIEKPVLEKPVLEKPILEKPVLERPVIEKPVLEKPVMERPVLERPVLERPILERPAIEKPAMERPELEKPVLEKPVMTKPTMERPAIEKPTVEETAPEKSPLETLRESSSSFVSASRKPVPARADSNPVFLRPVPKQPVEKTSSPVSQPSSFNSADPKVASPTTPALQKRNDPGTKFNRQNKMLLDEHLQELVDAAVQEYMDSIHGPHRSVRDGQKPSGNQPYGQKQGNQPYGQKQGNQPYGQKQGNQPYGQKQGNQPYGQKPNPNNTKNPPKPKAETFHVSSNLKYTPSLRLVELVFSPDPLSSLTPLTHRSAPHRSPPMDQRYMLSMLTPLPYDHYPAVWLSHTNRVLMRPFDILCHYIIGS